MKENNELIQFSIYKINEEKAKELLDVNQEKNIEELKNNIIEYLKNCIRKGNDNVLISDYDEFSLMLIKSKRNPIWKHIVEKMINDGNIIEDIKNKNILNESTSYILFTIVEGKIYAMTGGRGANYINKFIEKNYGLYLIPKIVDKNNPIIKKVVENNITGNNLSTERITKNVTSVSMEDRLGSIYRELNIQVSKDIAKKLGVEGIEDNRQIIVSSGDSVVIRKSISLDELKTILLTLSKLEAKEDNFILNYFIPVRKKGIKSSYLKEIMINKIQNEQYKDFQILSDNINEYYFSSYKYIIRENGKKIFEKSEPIILKDIVENLKDHKGNLYKSRIEQMLNNFEIETQNENGETIIYPEKVFNILRGSIEDEKNCFYLLNGSWYIFEEHFFEMLDNKYKDLYNNIEPIASNVTKKFNLIQDVSNEEEYNKKFEDDNRIIKVHTHEIKFIELADLIFSDKDNTYLMCNKGIFSGANVRDLENQIYTASKMLELTMKTDKEFIEKYYNSLADNEKRKITIEDFKNLFNKNIVFIAGFLTGYKKDTKSPYAKYLLNDLNKKLEISGFKLLITNYKGVNE